MGGNLDVNTKNIVFGDSGGANDDRLTFGAGTDLSIYHNGNNSFIENSTGNLHLKGKAGEESIVAIPDGAVELYHDNSKKFETQSDGVTIHSADDSTTGVKGDFRFMQAGTSNSVIAFDASASTLKFEDNRKAVFGAGDDLQIFHSGSHSFIKDTGTGQLVLNTNAFRVNNAA